MCHGISEILLFFFRKKCKYFLSKGNLSNKQQLKARPCLLSDPFFCPFHPEHIIYSLWHTETWLTICCCMQRCVHLCVLTLFCRTQLLQWREALSEAPVLAAELVVWLPATGRLLEFRWVNLITLSQGTYRNYRELWATHCAGRQPQDP